MGKKKFSNYYIPKQNNQAERIKEMLKQLELEGTLACFEMTAEKTKKSHGTYYDYLESVLEKQIIYREDSRLTRWTQTAHFPFRKTIKEFDFSFQPSIDKSQINDFLTCRFIDQGKNIIFLGASGVGKTHLSIGIGLEAIDRGLETRFLKLDELIESVEKSDENSSPRLFRTLIRPKLLILDDIDFYNTGKNASTFLFKLILKRHENRLSTIFTSNRTFNEWGELFGQPQRAGAALDRILNRVEIVNIQGESYRIKGKKK